MVDKLYSRRKIRLPKFERLREINSLKKILLIMFFTILISMIAFLRSAYPILKASCETAASSKGVKIINEEVNNVMKNYSYNSLIKIEKDVNGRISFIESNTAEMNKVVTDIVANIQKQFDNIPRITVFINMGSVSGISVLKNVEPQFEIELESAGTIESNIRTEFKSVGINQTQHKVFLQISSRVGILTPFSAFGKDINTEVLLTEAVIVGEVPDTYYKLEGLENTEDTFNFIE